MKNNAVYLGSVVRVIGSKVFVELTTDLPSAAPIINGKLYKVGQIGSFVKIPLGNLNVYGIVTMVGANPSDLSEENFLIPLGKRWLELQLVGEANNGREFERGVSMYPTIDDEVHLVTEEDLRIIYTHQSRSSIKIGHLASSEALDAFIDFDKLLTRHAAILGSTGSGKSNAVTSILKSLTAGQFPKAKIILIDPHSEYRNALSDRAKTFAIDDAENPLKIPYWGLSYNELALILYDKKTSTDLQPDMLIQEQILEGKRSIASKLKSGAIDENQITVDAPIPFNLKKIWFDLYLEENATTLVKQDISTIAYKKDASGAEMRGDYNNLIPPQFIPPAPGSAVPFIYKTNKILQSHLSKTLSKLKDNRYNFLFDNEEYDGIHKDIDDLLNLWLGHDQPITILDLGGVPFEIMDMVVGLISKILFESMFWGRTLPGFGRGRPILMVFEEAHSYLPRGGTNQTVSGYAGRAVRRICKEGRKYGVGSLVVSQRPSDLDETILSQCGTFITLRLSNSQDQAIINSAMPDNLGNLSTLLPSLRTGEAIVVGESVKIPSRIRLPLVSPRPDSQDPTPSVAWQDKSFDKPKLDKAITFWRKQKIEK